MKKLIIAIALLTTQMSAAAEALPGAFAKFSMQVYVPIEKSIVS